MPSFSLPLLPPNVSGILMAVFPGWWVSELPRLLCSLSLSLELSGTLLCGALPHLTSPAAGFANSSLSCALGNCRHKTDAAALFMAAFLWSTNPFAGVEFQSMILNTFPSLETFVFHKASFIQLLGEVCLSPEPLLIHFSGTEGKKFSQKLLGGQTGCERPQCTGWPYLEVPWQVTTWSQSARPRDSF